LARKTNFGFCYRRSDCCSEFYVEKSETCLKHFFTRRLKGSQKYPIDSLKAENNIIKRENIIEMRHFKSLNLEQHDSY
jgi:hypothetical protein